MKDKREILQGIVVFGGLVLFALVGIAWELGKVLAVWKLATQ